MQTSVDSFNASLDAVLSMSARLAEAAGLSHDLADLKLLVAQRVVAQARRNLDVAAAKLAGETARRSNREAGLSGLAQKEGFRTPEALVRHITGSTGREAVTLLRVGAMIHDASVAPSSNDADSASSADRPWLTAVGAAAAAGELSISGAEAIRNGLGVDDEGVSVDALTLAAATLIAISGLDADELFRRARAARDDLDEAGIAAREQLRRQQRSLRRWRKADGMTRYTWELDPEGAALVDGIYDQLTSPRRGGPRMVDEAEQERANSVEADPRTTDQLVSDGFLQLLTIAVGTDPRQIIGRSQPAVRVLVVADSLATRAGHGRLEGHADPVSIETVERLACVQGTVPVTFDKHGQPIDVGREQRQFTRRQRIALAARDGGCRWPGCERPPAWTEAHHVEHWKRDNGATDVANGILLCRHHHLLLHDNHWEIEQRGGDYWLIPPPEIDRAQAPRRMPSKSAAIHDLMSHRTG